MIMKISFALFSFALWLPAGVRFGRWRGKLTNCHTGEHIEALDILVRILENISEHIREHIGHIYEPMVISNEPIHGGIDGRTKMKKRNKRPSLSF